MLSAKHLAGDISLPVNRRVAHGPFSSWPRVSEQLLSRWPIFCFCSFCLRFCFFEQFALGPCVPLFRSVL